MLPNQTKPKLLVKAINAWGCSAYGNVFLSFIETCLCESWRLLNFVGLVWKMSWLCVCYFFTFLKRLYVKVGRRKKFIEWGWEAQWSALNREMPAQKENLRSEGKSK